MRLSKYESREYRKKKLEQDLRGHGLYVYRNARKDADLMLPKALADGRKTIGPNEEFQGDDYFMQLVRTNEARLVRTLITPQQEKESKMAEEKLICDQPDIITEQGKVEHVTDCTCSPKPINEGCPEACPKESCCNPPDVLINEDPMDGVVLD
jgi:hypothetical protein